MGAVALSTSGKEPVSYYATFFIFRRTSSRKCEYHFQDWFNYENAYCRNDSAIGAGGEAEHGRFA